MQRTFRAGRTAVACLISLLLGACAIPGPTRTDAGGSPAPAASAASIEQRPTLASDRNATAAAEARTRGGARTGDGSATAKSTASATGGDTEASATAKPRMFKGNDAVLAPAQPRGGPAPAAQDVSFKFEQAPVREVVHAVLGELLGLTYVLHQPIGGTVTVSTAAPVPADQALSVLEAVLQANGLLMARDASGVFHIGPPDAMRGVVPAPKRIEQAPLAPGFGTVIVPLKFIGAAEMAEILRPIARPEALLRVDNIRNLLILAGSRNQVEGWLEIVRTFDVDLLKGMSVGVFPLQYTSVRDIEAALRAMASPGEAAPAAPQAGAAAAAAAAQAMTLRQPLLGALRVIPLERLNSLLVVTPRAAYLDEVKQWIERLDRPSDTAAEPRLFVYPVQNGSASHLATVLNGIFGGGPSGPGAADTGVAPGLRSVTGTTTPDGRTTGGATATALSGIRSGAATGLGAGTLPQTGTRAATGAGVTSVLLGGNVRIVGDDLNNAVLVYAPPSEFRKIEETLKRLDSPATQVLIEATIVEVTLADELQYGLQWYFTDSPRGGLRGVGQLNLNSQGDIRPIQPGFSYTLTNSLGQVRAVLNALADQSLIRVISSPSLMVLDNHTAAISVGDQQPIRSSETVTPGGNVTQSIEYKDTGVLLTVTPSVNSGDVVSMSINQAVTDVGAIDAATGQRAFLQRQIGSRVAVRSGEALVLGGLIKDNTSGGSQGLPFLSRIPVLGALFGTKTQSIARTELLVIITPRVVRTAQDAREISSELRERMRGFRTLVDDQRGLLPKPLLDGAPQPREPVPSREGGKP